MSLVVDASFLVALLGSRGADGRWAEEIVVAGDLVAPHLVVIEATNILRRLESHGKLTPFEARVASRELLQLDLELVPFAPFAERVWQLRANLTSYDALYVAVAEEFSLPLATLDRRLARAPGPRCRFLTPT